MKKKKSLRDSRYFTTLFFPLHQVLELKNNRKNESFTSAWDTSNSWAAAEETTPEAVPVATQQIITPSGYAKYRAIYEFEARNSDEISFQPGDIVMVSVFGYRCEEG